MFTDAELVDMIELAKAMRRAAKAGQPISQEDAATLADYVLDQQEIQDD